ncbi:LytR/AlgR family response regulator transcription factor, partial [Clostridioides difficile]
MKTINGMDTARKIREFDHKLEIIFVTSFVEFMQEGYEVKAYRYILKPINKEKISKSVLPCINEMMKKRNNYLTINVKNYVDRIKIDSITYIETDRPNILIYT